MLGASRVSEGETIRTHAAFIWSVADLLRGDYKQSEYGKVILPLTVIGRLDCVLEPTKQAVLEKHKQLAGRIENVEPVLQAVAGQQFYNTSPTVGGLLREEGLRAATRGGLTTQILKASVLKMRDRGESPSEDQAPAPQAPISATRSGVPRRRRC